MTVKNLIESGRFERINEAACVDTKITEVYCCDLLSIAMAKAPKGGAWVTVMGNINTLAVASLTEMSCIILAEGASLDEAALKKAKEQEITVLRTELPVFKGALVIYQMIKNEALL